jgi:hypothetical protein
MSRGIPPVRTWRVRYHFIDGTHRDFCLDTISKRFACWLARDQAIDAPFVFATVERVTVSLVKGKDNGKA